MFYINFLQLKNQKTPLQLNHRHLQALKIHEKPPAMKIQYNSNCTTTDNFSTICISTHFRLFRQSKSPHILAYLLNCRTTAALNSFKATWAYKFSKAAINDPQKLTNQAQYLKYYWQHRQVRGCGSSNYGCITLFSFFCVGNAKRSLRKLDKEVFDFSVLKDSFLYHYRMGRPFFLHEAKVCSLLWNLLYQLP